MNAGLDPENRCILNWEGGRGGWGNNSTSVHPRLCSQGCIAPDMRAFFGLKICRSSHPSTIIKE